jgi:hypothetical protein
MNHLLVRFLPQKFLLHKVFIICFDKYSARIVNQMRREGNNNPGIFFKFLSPLFSGKKNLIILLKSRESNLSAPCGIPCRQMMNEKHGSSNNLLFLMNGADYAILYSPEESL